MYDGNPGEIDFGSSHRESTVVFLAVFIYVNHWIGSFPEVIPGGDKVPSKVLYGEAPSRGLTLYPFYLPVMTKKVPLSYSFH